MRLTMQLGEANSSVHKSRRTCTEYKARMARIESRRTEALLTVVVVEYQAALRQAEARAGFSC